MEENNTKKKEEVYVTLKGTLAMEKAVTLKRAIEIARLLAMDENVESLSIAGSSQPTVVPKVSNKANSSALEVIRNSKAKTFPQQITALAYYVTHRDGVEHFDPKDVQLLLRRMGNAPQNFGRDLLKAADLFGYIAKESPREYIVTEKGREFVENGFEGSIEGNSRRRKAHKAKSVGEDS